jgi:hypothetical protein
MRCIDVTITFLPERSHDPNQLANRSWTRTMHVNFGTDSPCIF